MFQAHGAVLPPQIYIGASAFRRDPGTSCYHFLELYHDSFFILQILEVLLLYGAMYPILRVCAHYDVGIKKWCSATQCHCGVGR
jgi:hypothetical protein